MHPGPDEPRRRDRPAGRRLRRLADHRAGPLGARRPHGRALRPARRRARRRRARRWRSHDPLLAGRARRQPHDPRRPGDRPGAATSTAPSTSRSRTASSSRIEPAVESARGLVLAPAFVDPHVHLRVPGREDEETIASGTAAAAAGGYCAILAMPNTDPVVDSAAVLGALIEQAREEAVIPTGFMAAISKGLAGEELTEMAELARLGRGGVHRRRPPGRLRRPDAARAPVQRRHRQAAGAARGGADASRATGRCTKGAVSAELGLAGWPSVAESVMIERDCALAAYEQRPLHIMHLSARESVAAVRAAQARGVAVSAEVSPHHLCLTDDTVRTLDTNRKMNPPLRSEDDRQALLEGAPRRHDRLHRDRSRAARAAREGRAVRGGAVRRHRARDGVRGALHVPRRAGRARPRPRARADVSRARRGSSGCRCRGSRWASAPTSSCSISMRPGRVTEDGFRSKSVNSWLLGETLRGAVVKTIADGRVVHAA